MDVAVELLRDIQGPGIERVDGLPIEHEGVNPLAPLLILNHGDLPNVRAGDFYRSGRSALTFGGAVIDGKIISDLVGLRAEEFLTLPEPPSSHHGPVATVLQREDPFCYVVRPAVGSPTQDGCGLQGGGALRGAGRTRVGPVTQPTLKDRVRPERERQLRAVEAGVDYPEEIAPHRGDREPPRARPSVRVVKSSSPQQRSSPSELSAQVPVAESPVSDTKVPDSAANLPSPIARGSPQHSTSPVGRKPQMWCAPMLRSVQQQ